jgi:IclR family transcriptional regulator, KDG regulon repressor
MGADSSQTLTRGLKLLNLIAEGHEGVPVRELVARMQLPRSIVQRLLYTLEAEGFLERHPSQAGYRLAIKLWSLGCASIRRLSVRDVARPYLEDLARKTNEVTKIGVLDGSEVVYVDKVDCRQPVRAYVPIGGRAPAHSVATGKAILAFLPPEVIEAIEFSPRNHAKSASADRESLVVELKQIRKRGYAVNRDEWEQGVGAIAAPLFDGHGEAIASIGIIFPSSRFSQTKATQMGALTLRAAAEISRKLGHDAGNGPLAMKRAG